VQIQLELEQPALIDEVSSPAALDKGLYRRVYALRGPPGETLLQQVTVEIELERGGQVLVGYRGRYLEYFQLDAQGRAQPDTHDLVLRRDGWDPTAVRRLLRHHGLDKGSSHESHLRATKTFRLGLGQVEDAPVHASPEPGSPGAAFGFLAEGPAPLEAAVWVSSVDGSGERKLVPESPCPFGYAPAGSGRFLSPQGWVARERFSYRYTTRSGRLEAEGYQPMSLAPFAAPNFWSDSHE
tara:strand:+ start:621 stop:1337 length:717 start_codon:yes stop_codon:yes gene_type:complete